MSFKCPKCEYEIYERVKFCPECGFDFTSGQKRCPRCRQQIDINSEICPSCGLDFEKWSFMVPRMVALGVLILLVALIFLFPIFWKSTPWLHKKGIISEGYLRSNLEGSGLVPMFIHYKTGERLIEQSRSNSGYYDDTSYIEELIPLPEQVIFHYDIPIGETVWIIERETDATSEWIRIGRYGRDFDKYGWVHESNIRVID